MPPFTPQALAVLAKYGVTPTIAPDAAQTDLKGDAAITGDSATLLFDADLRTHPASSVTAGGVIQRIAELNLEGALSGAPHNWSPDSTLAPVRDGQAQFGAGEEFREGDVGGVSEFIVNAGVASVTGFMKDVAAVRDSLGAEERSMFQSARETRAKLIELRAQLLGQATAAREALRQAEEDLIDRLASSKAARIADVLLGTTAGFDEGLAGGITRRTLVSAGALALAGSPGDRAVYTEDYLGWLAAHHPAGAIDSAALQEQYARERQRSPLLAGDSRGRDTSGALFVRPNPRLSGRDILITPTGTLRGRFSSEQIEDLLRELVAVDRDHALGFFARSGVI